MLMPPVPGGVTGCEVATGIKTGTLVASDVGASVSGDATVGRGVGGAWGETLGAALG